MTRADILIGVDVGGTFTDAVLIIGQQVHRAKSPSTYPDIAAGVLQSCRLAAVAGGLVFDELLPRVRRFGLGTTAITNVIATRTGLRVGLLATRGFEETLPLARGRVQVEDGWLAPPPLLVDPAHIVGIAGRIDSHGHEVTPLDEAAVLAAARYLAGEGIDSIAIAFLWSFLNPAHELRAAELLRAVLPDIPVTSAAELRPVIREYERTSLAVMNAYSYGAYAGVDALADMLRTAGLTAPVLLCHSGGGTMSIAQARAQPVWLAASGPAAGVAAAATIAQRAGSQSALTCDLGGTSYDVAHIANGSPARVQRGDLMGIYTALPRVDVESVGAGGGSLAWVDERRMIRVGPRSAGSSPGPACYGRGGTQPALTDALLVLGYIDPDRFLGGQMRLDRVAAVDACARLGEPLAMDAEETAWGIHQIALVEMTKAARARLSNHALVPTAHDFVSYGGCGSLFATDVARLAGMKRVLVPELASVLSAFGAATMDIRRERVRSLLLRLPCSSGRIDRAFTELRAAVWQDLAADGVAEAERAVFYEADMRFADQRWELAIALPDVPASGDGGQAAAQRFRAEYLRRFGAAASTTATSGIVELVALRATGVGHVAGPIPAANDRAAAPPPRDAPAVGSRLLRLARGGPAVSVATYDGARLMPGDCLSGPALVDGSDTTAWICAGADARMDNDRTLLIEVDGVPRMEAAA
jgi:N-methylhydantoinase A